MAKFQAISEVKGFQTREFDAANYLEARRWIGNNCPLMGNYVAFKVEPNRRHRISKRR